MLAHIKQLARHEDDRGYLTEIFRHGQDVFGFGQIYLTTCASGVVKAWHRHEHQTDRWFCVAGAAKVGVHDGIGGETHILSADNPKLLTIPRYYWHGFTPCWGFASATILNIPSKVYDPECPDETRLPFDALDFNWRVENR